MHSNVKIKVKVVVHGAVKKGMDKQSRIKVL